jgi:hypothetical protein
MHPQFARPIEQGDGAGVAWTSALESSKAARKCRPARGGRSSGRRDRAAADMKRIR